MDSKSGRFYKNKCDFHIIVGIVFYYEILFRLECQYEFLNIVVIHRMYFQSAEEKVFHYILRIHYEMKLMFQSVIHLVSEKDQHHYEIFAKYFPFFLCI